MKILYIIGSLDQKGGTERVLANKANYFVDKFEDDIHIIINEHNTQQFAYDFSSKITFHNLNISQYLINPKLPIIARFLLKRKLNSIYKQKINEIQPDVIIVLQHDIYDSIIPKYKLKTPIIREFHSSIDVIKLRATFIKNIIKRNIFLHQTIKRYKNFDNFDYVILLTQKEADKKILKTQSVVIPNMIDKNIYNQKRDYNNHSKNVISIGSMRDNGKRFDIQIKVWKEVIKKHPNWKLNIYGDGIERVKLQNLIDELKLTNYVILHGITNNVYEKFKQSSFFLFTSMAEGLPMVLIEALSCGLPVISFDCPEGPSEIIKDGKEGFLIENGNKKELQNKIEEIIENSELRERMSFNAFERSHFYRPKNISQKWKNFFNSITPLYEKI